MGGRRWQREEGRMVEDNGRCWEGRTGYAESGILEILCRV